MAQPPTVGGHGSGIPIPPEPLRPARNPPDFNWIDDLFQFLIPVRSAFKYISRRARSKDGQRRKGKKRKPLTQENIPLELTLVLSSYISTLAKRKTIDAPTVSAMLLSVSNFTTALASLERILTTPIPVGYAIHLKHVVWLYLLVLPFQIEAALKWVSIPAVAISAFVFLGLLSIGTEIENPFGYDLNDLNMDYFCQRIIHREMLEITSHPSESLSPDIFIYSTQNVPFHPQDNRNAEELLSVRNARNHVERALSSSTLDHIERTKTYNGRADGRDPIEAVAEA
ncbi:UPF0187-domain-containing protein [Atractiella rhizophila]|nr:UPF0187-domain-containing protein [Atractiella rhizophila]